jgi:hypothetical protein
MQDICTRLGLETTGLEARLVNPQALLVIEEWHPGYELAPVVATMLGSPESIRRFANLRLDAQVSRCLNMNAAESKILLLLAGGQPPDVTQSAEAFYDTLLEVLQQQKLHKLFCRAEGGEFHRSITPSAYNEFTGEVYAQEMARWRSDFRDMAPERQMMAATIIWLQQSGRDSTWLRRVPCTWLATEALNYMKDAGCLAAWMRLLATYPGW